ncbi:MAG: DnaB-like helicase C-terminal domain-containing protein [Planctomycetota bacterium]
MSNDGECGKKGIAEYKGEDRVVSAYELSLTFKETDHYTINIKSGIPSLDYYCDGFRDGELITISGKTKNGKTLLAQSLSANFSKLNHPPLWFCFEVPARQFLSQFDKTPFIYMPSKLKAHAMDWIEERIMESFAKYNTRIVFIDHLHYLFDIQKSRNPSLDIGAIIRRLKGIAVNNEFVIFLLCHTSKAKDENESYECIRDSSFVAQESDCVIMVKRTPMEGEGESYARARVEFHRRTGVMEKVIFLQKVENYLVERRANPGEGETKEKGRYKEHDNN